jgi:hypothetical protein
MREANDLITVRVTTTRELTVDLEQLEANPIFRSIIDSLRTNPELTPSELVRKTIVAYVLQYIWADAFPHRTPGTTGPGSIHNVIVEVSKDPGT